MELSNLLYLLKMEFVDQGMGYKEGKYGTAAKTVRTYAR